ARPAGRRARESALGAPGAAQGLLRRELPLARGSPGLLELLRHRLGEGVHSAHRPDEDAHAADPAVVPELEVVDPVELAVADPGAEDERRRVAGLDLVR